MITSSILMPGCIYIWQGGWKTPNGIPEHSWRNPSNWKPHTTRSKALGRYLKLLKLSEGPLIDNRPAKRVKIKGAAY